MITVLLEKSNGYISLNELNDFQDYLFYQLAQALKGVMTKYESKQKTLGFGGEGS